jgi:hypothetical protein
MDRLTVDAHWGDECCADGKSSLPSERRRGESPLKVCVYCAEQVKAEAVRCRFCGQPLPLDCLDLTERGKRYGIGPRESAGQLGIWDLSVGGRPVRSFPDDHIGWPRALAEYESLERGGQAGFSISVAIVGLGGVLVAVGSVLPWVKATAPFVGTLEVSGMEGDGIFTLMLGVVIVAVGLAGAFSSRRTALATVVILAAIAAGLVAGVALANAQDRVEAARSASEFILASVGAGIWTILAGAALAAGAGFFLPRR